MPTINCAEAACPLRSVDTLPKFCPDCGCQAASKVVRPTCISCGHPFDDTLPKFCPECGSKVLAAVPPRDEPPPPLEPGERPYGSWRDLVREHEDRKRTMGPPGGQTGRGLSPEEIARLERSLRKAPDRVYSAPDPEGEAAYRDITRREIPTSDSAHRAGLPEASGRTAIQAPEGQHRPGQLSSKDGQKFDRAEYARDVRLIPYTFKTRTRTRDMVGGSRPDPSSDLTDDEKKYYEGMDETPHRQLSIRLDDDSSE